MKYAKQTVFGGSIVMSSVSAVWQNLLLQSKAFSAHDGNAFYNNMVNC
jgi:hypothetical protein